MVWVCGSRAGTGGAALRHGVLFCGLLVSDFFSMMLYQASGRRPDYRMVARDVTHNPTDSSALQTTLGADHRGKQSERDGDRESSNKLAHDMFLLESAMDKTLQAAKSCTSSPSSRAKSSNLLQVNGAVPRVDRERLAAAVQFAVDLRLADHSFHRHGHVQADVTVSCGGVDTHLQIARQCNLDTARAGDDVPGHVQCRALQGSCIDAPVAALDLQGVKSSRETDAAIAGIGFVFAIEITTVNRSISGAQAHATHQRTHGNAAIAAVQVNHARKMIRADRAVMRMNGNVADQSGCVHRPVTGFDLQVAVFRHPNLDMHSSPAQHDPELADYAGGKLDLIALLAGIDV